MDGETGEFCNSFWGNSEDPGPERGYEALMGRMKGAGRMVEDFKAFFKERSVDYIENLAQGSLTGGVLSLVNAAAWID